MPKAETHFEQVPLEVVKQIAQEIMRSEAKTKQKGLKKAHSKAVRVLK
jgi:hypothetical protein